ncbi:Fur-regulated basic protein FbpA [Sutcliffiella rhizosphaerae]|uniref:Uncharacterized protein n=1 Tax=Sutcliffiella rhizosphaerae TaxID=2880967 RepID=A0ABM8YQ88_9BACI|nr:Fur-regulated basic protein FbpA [Sutcliffiella rhizosphaerae]CAG9621975.1 hypothetical protein BACCIP111883_02766 [Sutcliffiella rhizosphaerae]
MAKLISNAIDEAREYYTRTLVEAGFFSDSNHLSSYTLSELKKEYTTLIGKGTMGNGDQSNVRINQISK